MNAPNLAVWLTDVSITQPCGDDEEYSPEFQALDQAVTGKPDAQYGGTVIPAVPPDWAQAATLACVLLARSRDLRVAAHYTRASLMRDGFAGLARGLALVEGLLETRWDSVHPQLDPTDLNDATARVNALSALIGRAELPAQLREVPFVSARGQRPLTLRDIEWLRGETPVPDGVELPSEQSVGAVFAEAGAAQIEATHTAVRAAIEATQRIEALLMQRVGPTHALDFVPLIRPLSRIADFITAHAGNVEEGTAQDGGPVDGQETDALFGIEHSGHAPQDSVGRIANAQDVLVALDTICGYYARYEPSSPVPVLLQRARRLVGKSFIEIIEDVAPDGAGQFRHLGGVV